MSAMVQILSWGGRRKAIGPVYKYLNINTRVHVKERHRLFEKSRGSSQYCWLYFKTTLIYSRLYQGFFL